VERVDRMTTINNIYNLYQKNYTIKQQNHEFFKAWFTKTTILFMKKIFLILPLLLIGLLSCSNIEDALVSTEQDDTVAQEKPTTRGVQNGIYHSLGVSYDITDEYLDIDATKFPVVDISAYLSLSGYPNSYIPNTASEGDILMYAGATAKDFLEEINIKTKANRNASFGEIASVSLRFESDMNIKNTYSTKYSYARADVIKRIKRVYLNATPDMLQPYVYPEFLRDLDRFSPDEFVKRYGTHVLLDITIGGKLQFNYRSEIIEESSSAQKKLVVESGAKVGIKKFGADIKNNIDISILNQSSSKNAKWDLRVKYIGGAQNGSSVSFNSEGYLSSTFNIGTWESSVTESNAAILEINWESAYPISEFIADPVKRAAIEAAIKRYVQDELKMVEVKPLYRLHRDTPSFNSFYSSSFEEFRHYQNIWYYFPYNGRAGGSYILGYVFSTPQPGTVPLYRLWDPKRQNSHYSSVLSEANLYRTYGYDWDYGINNSHILGYIYTHHNQEVTVAPIHRLFNRNRINTFLSSLETESSWYQKNGYERYNGTASYILGYLLP
jgi:hypothetical protein